MSKLLPPGWKLSADGVKVQTRAGRQSFWDNEYTEDYDEAGNVHVPTKASIKNYEANMPAFDMAQEVDFGGGRMSTADVQKLAQKRGWADPMAFDTSMLVDVQQSRTGGGEGGTDPATFGTARFKDDVANARGINGSKRNQNSVKVKYKQNEDGTYDVDGYIVNAGAVSGTKNHTALLYEYDKYGRFKGANTDMEERGLEGAIPLVGIAMMALTAGGAGAAIGGGINSAANLGLAAGGFGEAALGGAALGAGSAALTGQNPIKGAVMGAITPGIKAVNPGGLLGLSGNAAMAANLGVGAGVKAAVSGKSPNLINTGIALAGGWR